MAVPTHRNEKKHTSRPSSPYQAYKGVPLRDSGVEYGRLPLREEIPASNPRHPLDNVRLIPLADESSDDYDDFEEAQRELYDFDWY